MKIKIKVKAFGNVEKIDVVKNGVLKGWVYRDESGSNLIQVNKNGDLVDLFAYADTTIKGPAIKTIKGDDGRYTAKTHKVNFDWKLIPLGVAMKLPEGMKANVYPRSSLFGEKMVMLTNSVGQIDGSYCGNNDIWKFGAVAFADATINANERIAQFEVVPGKNATWWQKLKWLLSSGYEFEFVDSLDGEDRGGHGTSGGYKA